MGSRQVARVPFLNQLGAAVWCLHADREHPAYSGRTHVAETSIEFSELLAAHGTVQPAEEHHQREASVGATAQR